MEWEIKPGDTIDGWKLTKRLGKGGNGEVWVAKHAELGEGALKLLKLQFQGEAHKRYLRFRDEATMHKQLAERHAGVLPFLGCSLPENPTRDTPAWLATTVAVPAQEALEGEPFRKVVEAVAAVAETLAALHGQDIAHRDIKPDNLFFHKDRWVIGDFGLVDYPDKETRTDTGERLGPYHYLAPEMQDEANRSDGRKADIYSLGKTLWVLATELQNPIPGELRADNSQLNIGAYRAVPRTSQLDLLIERATRHAPNLRPAMAEFAEELRAWLATPAEHAQPDLSDVLARLRSLAPPALRSADERANLMNRAQQLSEELRAGLTAIAQKLSETGLSDGSIGTTTNPDVFFMRMLSAGHIWGTNFVCRASLPVGSRVARLSCTVTMRVYHNNTVQFCGGYRVGMGDASERPIGDQFWGGNLGSAMQAQAVSELLNSLGESLRESLKNLAELAEKESMQR